MTLLKLKKILDALKDRVRLISLKFIDSDNIQISYDNGSQYCVKLNLKLKNSNCKDFSCNLHDFIKALDCLNSNRSNSIFLDGNKLYSGDKSVELELNPPMKHDFISIQYSDSYPTTDLLECLEFVSLVTSETLPKFEWLQFHDGLVQASCGYAIHEYNLIPFKNSFSVHRSAIFQLTDFLRVLEEYDILNPSEFIRGGLWKDGYAFYGEDADFSFEVIFMTSKATPYTLNIMHTKIFKLNRSDIYDVCIQANKSKSSYIEFYNKEGIFGYSFKSKTKTLKVSGSIPVSGIFPDFKIDSKFLYQAIPEGRIVEVHYSEPKQPFLFSTGNRFRAYIAPMI